MNRRSLIVGGGAAAFAATTMRAFGESYTPPPFGPQIANIGDPRDVLLDLDARENMLSLPAFAGQEMPLWTFGETFAPIVRMRFGDRLVAKFANNLPRAGEHTSIHWHGLRLPNSQDGVPYISQPPVNPGDVWDYTFTPPDAGTFFFHTHCNTVEQLGRGLAGVLIVEGDDDGMFDADEMLVLKDWRIGDDGRFLPFITSEGAKRRGSFGTIRSCNGATNPTISLPASGDVRLRILNADNARVMMLGVAGAEAFVIAVDGIACPPFPLRTWMAGPAMRFDLLIRAPAEGQTAELVDYFAPEPVRLATFVGEGAARRGEPFVPRALRQGRIPEVDLANAERMKFAFGVAAGDTARLPEPMSEFEARLLGELCLSYEVNWTINGQFWPGRDHSDIPPPVAQLKLGQSYIFELSNTTSVHHPIHIHGHTFRVLKSNKRKRLPDHYSDTVLLAPKERLTVAFVADNPGDWMFHCHLIEHQETGMMSYLRVS